MIASVRGVLLELGDGTIIVESAGVGYELHISMATRAALPAPGHEVRLHTRHIVREDAQLLFGFTERDELRLFDLLIGVNGVGPRIAIAVLSGMAPAQFARAVRDENIAAITAVNGVGRKTAERLVVELRDKLAFLPVVVSGPSAPADSAAEAGKRGRKPRLLEKSERFEDAIAALVTLGYSPAQASEAVRRVSEDAGDAAAEDLVKRALAVLSRPTLVTR
jgi:Holliday junction DNA helicase RuvA